MIVIFGFQKKELQMSLREYWNTYEHGEISIQFWVGHLGISLDCYQNT